jgi:hypothetical protein
MMRRRYGISFRGAGRADRSHERHQLRAVGRIAEVEPRRVFLEDRCLRQAIEGIQHQDRVATAGETRPILRIEGRRPNASGQKMTAGCAPVVGWMNAASQLPSGVSISTLVSVTGSPSGFFVVLTTTP